MELSFNIQFCMCDVLTMHAEFRTTKKTKQSHVTNLNALYICCFSFYSEMNSECRLFLSFFLSFYVQFVLKSHSFFPTFFNFPFLDYSHSFSTSSSMIKSNKIENTTNFFFIRHSLLFRSLSISLVASFLPFRMHRIKKAHFYAPNMCQNKA